MGFSDRRTAEHFHRTSDGKTIFYPWGVLGAGYEIPNDQKYQEIYDSLKKFNSICLSIILFSAGLGLLLLPIITIIWIILVKKWVRGLVKANEKLTLHKQAKDSNLDELWFGAIVSLLFVVGGIWLIFNTQGNHFLGIVTILFFGSAGIFEGWMIWIKKS